ncbi:MAG: hypothetical protein ACJ8E3_07975 [Sphingomicrobium sp.]
MIGRKFIRALVFGTAGAGVQVLAFLGILRPLLGLSETLALALALGGAAAAAPFGAVVGWKHIYSLEPRAIWAFLLDVSWSAINTLTGLAWLLWCAFKGSYQPPTPDTRKRGIIVFSGAAMPGAAATTLGTVVGGEWLLHEAVHVQQARIFGPLYWPIYLTSYVSNVLARILLLRVRDVHWESYGRVVMEDWAYRSTPHGHSAVERGPSAKWSAIALLHALAILVMLAPVAGFALIPWWSGALASFGYAFARALRPKATS